MGDPSFADTPGKIHEAFDVLKKNVVARGRGQAEFFAIIGEFCVGLIYSSIERTDVRFAGARGNTQTDMGR